MTDHDTAARIDELETRLAFQEHSLQELSDALAASRAETTRVQVMLQRVLAELAQSRGPDMANPADEPPPPHY